MNILMVSPFDLRVKRFWGPTIRLHSLAKELKRRGHRIILAGPPPFNSEMPYSLEGIELYYFKKPFYRYPYIDHWKEIIRKGYNLKRKLPFVLINRLFELMRLIKKNNINVLYVNRSFIDTAYPAFFSHIFKRVPIICDWDDLEGLHGFSTSFCQPLKMQLFETFNEVVFPRLADATVVASLYLYEFAINIGVSKSRLFYAPSVADSVIFHPDVNGASIREQYGLKGRKVILYCGNLIDGNSVKVENILYTLKYILQKDSTFSMLVVGDGDLLKKDGEKGKLVKLAETLGIIDKVIFTGGVPHIEVPKYIAASDICIALFPVNVITMVKSPLKVYEYMASGKAIVARDVGEISGCVIDGETGILVYSDSPKEYSEKILECFSEKGLIQKLGSNARRLFEEKFSWEHSADAVINACEFVLVRRNIGNF